jgi:hypothetical protein
MSQAVAKTFGEGVRSIFRLSSLFVVAIGIVFSYLADRSHADLGGVAFGASITVLVFLLPASGIVGPYLLAETKDALSIISKASDQGQSTGAYQVVKDSLQAIIDVAEPLQCGFSYTTLAVVLSALSLVQSKQSVAGIDIDRVLAATSLALLVGTAAMVFPMTWQLLQLKQVKSIFRILETEQVAAPVEQRSPQADGRKLTEQDQQGNR